MESRSTASDTMVQNFEPGNWVGVVAAQCGEGRAR